MATQSPWRSGRTVILTLCWLLLLGVVSDAEAQSACSDNSGCAPDQYCATPPGACEEPGTCAARPDVCAAIVDPVIGCDKRKYSNECEAHAAGVSVIHKGDCGSLTECNTNTDCEDNQACIKRDGDCDGPGFCVNGHGLRYSVWCHRWTWKLA